MVHGLSCSQHVGSSQTFPVRCLDRTCICCISRPIPIHCTTWEVPFQSFFFLSIHINIYLMKLEFNLDVVVIQLLNHVRPFVTPWTAACQASLSFTISWNLFKFMSIELVMLSNHLILYHPLHLLPSIFPNIRVFSNELAL